MMSVTFGNTRIRSRATDITNHTYLRDSDENVGRWTIEFLSPPIRNPR